MVRGPRLIIPSGLLLVVVAMLVPLTTAANRSSGVARIVVIAVLAAAIADGWLAYHSLRRLHVDIATPAVATNGERFAARAVVTGTTRPASIDGLFGDQPPRPFAPGEPFDLDCLPGQRGVFHHLLVEVRSRSPLGLWTAARRVGVRLAVPMQVGPRPRPADDTAPVGEDGPDGAGRLVDRRGPDLTRSLREYRPGDPARLVHWPASAHRGELMVRETEAEQRPVPVVVVGATSAGPAAEAAFGRSAHLVGRLLTAYGAVRLVTTEAVQSGAETTIPRSALVPGAPPRGRLVAPGPVVTVDDVVDDPERARVRLARAAPAWPGRHDTGATDGVSADGGTGVGDGGGATDAGATDAGATDAGATEAGAPGPDPWPGAWWVTDEGDHR